MGDTVRSVASAVVLPDFNEPSQPTIEIAPNTHKRRQSSISSTNSKRPRLSEVSSDEPPVDRRRGHQISGEAEERKRGQRLFGGLLSTLSQSSKGEARAAAREKRKAEIEKKQAEKLKLRDEEYGEEKKRKLEGLIRLRKREQWVWDEQAMRIRHSNMLASARFLHTTSEPKLYYKPWELVPEEEDRIERQIADAEAAIDRELADFEERLRQWENEDAKEDAEGANNERADTSSASARQKGTKEGESVQTQEPVGSVLSPSDATINPTNDDTVHDAAPEDTTKDPMGEDDAKDSTKVNGARETTQDEDAKDAREESADHVMEAGEDAVIY